MKYDNIDREYKTEIENSENNDDNNSNNNKLEQIQANNAILANNTL